MNDSTPSTSSSGSFPTDFTCPVCRDVLQTPVRAEPCHHIFCRKCLITATRARGLICPLCRGGVSKKDRVAPTRAADVELEMRKCSGLCMYCAKRVKFNYMKIHYKTCKKYQEECGLLPKEFVKAVTPTMQVEPAYTCPLCQNQHLSRMDLLNHCNDVHSSLAMAAICPICVTFPWGDPNHRSENFVGHLNSRHQFDYKVFMNIDIDEEAQLRDAIEKSKQTSV
ncbi:E3 ubiquitin-protein ligase RNF138 [Pelodytes ibericus]